MREPVLSVEGLTTEFATARGTVQAVQDVDLALAPGETLGLVGESGSGKSVTARSVMRLLDDNGRIAAGSVEYRGTDLTDLAESELTAVRGDDVAMVFQDPMTALTPVLTVGTQITETLQHHRDVDEAEARSRALDLLDRVRIPDPGATLDAYPHELSGGQRQRVLIAIAVSCDPDVLLADEPTTALDVTIEAQILDLLAELADERDMALLQITHDLGVVAETCDRVAVMYAGRIVEEGPVESVFSAPRHPYTAGLLRSTPRIRDVDPELLPGTVPDPGDRPQGCNFAPRCPHATEECRVDDPPLAPPGAASADGGATDARETTTGTGDRVVACVRADRLGPLEPIPTPDGDAESGERGETRAIGDPVLGGTGLRKEFASAGSLVDRVLPGGDPPVQAVDGVDLAVHEGETLGLVGESGSGKTTLGRVLIALDDPTDGTVRFDGRPLADVPEAELRERVQFVFQDPSSSLNPRQSVGRILGYAVEKHGTHGGDPGERVASLLEEVGLPPEMRERYPHELSGGQKQRVGVARALAVDPDVLIADEPTSALDVSVQGQLLALLEDIRAERGLSMVFVSHDLSVVRHVADRVAVMYLGRVVEVGDEHRIFEEPRHPYTRALVSAVPEPDPGTRTDRITLEGEIPDPRRPPEGCNFVTRCPEAMPECHETDPALVVPEDADADSRGGENGGAARRDEVACLLWSDAARENGT